MLKIFRLTFMNYQLSKKLINLRSNTKKYINYHKGKFILGGAIPGFFNQHDAIDQDLINKKNYKFDDYEELTAFERVKKAFSYDNEGVPSPELELVRF